jgi:hypothetical protein
MSRFCFLFFNLDNLLSANENDQFWSLNQSKRWNSDLAKLEKRKQKRDILYIILKLKKYFLDVNQSMVPFISGLLLVTLLKGLFATLLVDGGVLSSTLLSNLGMTALISGFALSLFLSITKDSKY